MCIKTDIGDNLELHTPEKALCNTKTLENLWNKSLSGRSNNVYKNYVKKPESNQRYKIIDMGVFCIENDITPDMLRMGVRHIKEVAALLNNKQSKEHNKVVIMSEEDYKTYELFKKMKAFNEAKR